MSVKVSVFNPSHHWTSGYVTTLWKPIYDTEKIPPAKVAVYDSSGNKLKAQVDEIDPNDPSRATLVFWLDKQIRPEPDSYWLESESVTVDAEGPGEPEEALPRYEIEGPLDNPTGVKLINNRLHVRLSLVPDPYGDKHKCYSGSAHSVVLDEKEILDAFRAEATFLGHDLEKRCLQIDRIQVSHPAWAALPSQEFCPIDKPYELVSRSRGPVRVSVTIASSFFDYTYWDPFAGKNRQLKCRLFRVINLYRGADFITEELYVKGVPDEKRAGSKSVEMCFTARYFTYMNLSLEPSVFQHSNIPDWFAIGCRWEPNQGYGFATDIHSGPVITPDPCFPNKDNEHKSFVWELNHCRGAKCIHMFKRNCRPRALESNSGQYWYRHIFRPLSAGISNEGASHATGY
jgi:hypothetical protein